MTYRVLHIITRLIVGGAQENTLYSAELINDGQFQSSVLSGIQTGPEGSLIENAAARGIRLFLEPSLVRELHPWKDLMALSRLTLFIRRGRFDVVHTHSSKAGILGRVAAWLAGTPVIVHTVHGWGFHERQRTLTRRLFILLEQFADLMTDQWIAVTRRDIEKGVRQRIGKPNDYITIRSGIDVDRFRRPGRTAPEVRATMQIPQDAFVIGTVTRLSPQKSPFTFLKVAESISKKIENAWFVMVGDGPLRSGIEAAAEHAGIRKRLVLTGIRHDVPELLSIFNVFLLTSLWEGLPRVIPQAMAAGIPVVASRVDGNAEIIHDGINGMLVDPEDIQAFADRVSEIVSTPELRHKLRDRALEQLEEYSVGEMVRRLKKMYLAHLKDKFECTSNLETG